MKELLKKADIFGLAIVAAALVAYSVQEFWTIYQTVAVIAGGLIVVVSVALKFDQIRAGLGRRSTRFGANSLTSVVLLVGVLALANYLGNRHQQRFDMTTEKTYSLSDQSANVAGEIKDPVQVKAFYTGGDYPPTKDLLQLFKARNSQIAFEFVDPDKQPQIAQQYNVTVYGDFQNPLSGEQFRYGTVVLEMGGKSQRIEKQSEPLREEDMTNALMKLVKGETKTIYFIEGHGEKGINSTERTGFNAARESLERENYAVKALNLVTSGQVPDDTSVIVVAGPASDPFPNEIEMIQGFLDKGGSVLLMVDPNPAPSLSDFLAKWSVKPGSDFVVDASGVGRLFGAGPTIPLVASYGTHKITDRFNVMTFFPMARSLTPVDPPASGVTTEKLLQTNERSWGETNLRGNEAVFDEKSDLQGPVTLAVVATKDLGENKKARLVAYGDSDFASNGFFQAQGNGNLFLNTINWLAQDENFISIRPKAPTDRPVTMTQAQGRMSFYLSVVFLPLSILIAGTSVWMKRRK